MSYSRTCKDFMKINIIRGDIMSHKQMTRLLGQI